jgi:hypothetical protein
MGRRRHPPAGAAPQAPRVPTTPRLGFRKVQTVGAEGGGEPGVAGDEHQDMALPADGDQPPGKAAAGIGLAVAHDHRAAGWQAMHGGFRVGHALVIGHQDDRRQTRWPDVPFETAAGVC